MPHPKSYIIQFQPPHTHSFQSPTYLLRSVTQGAALGSMTHPLLPSARETCSPYWDSARPQQLVSPILNNYRGLPVPTVLSDCSFPQQAFSIWSKSLCLMHMHHQP